MNTSNTTFRFKSILIAGAMVLITFSDSISQQKQSDQIPPNIILIMADDMGYGDVAYNGNKKVKTPVLDEMARTGLQFNRFYSGAPVCTPTRASALTGRHPYRMNMSWASAGTLPNQENTIAEVLRNAGYATGHFGKWHLGTLSKTIKEGYAPGPVKPEDYAPPWENGFDESYTVYSSMPTYNPYYLNCAEKGGDCWMVMDKPVAPGQMTGGFQWNMKVWTGPGKFVDEWLQGTFDELVMDKATDFIQRKAQEKKPFLSVIWLTTPHAPIVASDRHRALYPGMTIREQHWFGALTAMDEQIGRLRQMLKDAKISDNTVIWFCSDNGPSWVHELNSTAGLNGKKGSLSEGGIRVPAILEWPGKFKDHKAIDIPVSTSDFFPTLLKWVGIKLPGHYPIDGIDVTDILNGKVKERSKPIGFQSPVLEGDSKDAQAWLNYSGKQIVWLDNKYKLMSMNEGKTWALYDLSKDWTEKTDISAYHPTIVKKMKQEVNAWMASCQKSAKGDDYKITSVD